MTDDIARLRGLIDALPESDRLGVYRVRVGEGLVVEAVYDGDSTPIAQIDPCRRMTEEGLESRAAYLAAVSPDVLLRLLDRLELAEGALSEIVPIADRLDQNVSEDHRFDGATISALARGALERSELDA